MFLGIEAMRGMDIASDNHSDTIDCLNSACAFMHSSINRTMDYSKLSSGLSLSSSMATFNLRNALNNPIKWMKSMLPCDGRLSIILHILPMEIDMIITDKHWVEENLLCLLSNAVKYSSRGKIEITVTLRGELIRVTVQDTGIGISPESKIKLFKQFSKLQNMATGGTGLGLYSLSKRSDAIGGSCGMHDREDGNQGSAFWYEFPYTPAKDHLTPINSVMVSRKPSFSVKKMTILLVDDSPLVLNCLSKQLTGMKHNVITACNGADGVEKMIEMKNQIDFVIMDVQMPVMDGIEATKRYRQIELLDHTRTKLPIICSSANLSDEMMSLALNAGVCSFLPKPFNSKDLSAVVTAVAKKVK